MYYNMKAITRIHLCLLLLLSVSFCYAHNREDFAGQIYRVNPKQLQVFSHADAEVYLGNDKMPFDDNANAAGWNADSTVINIASKNRSPTSLRPVDYISWAESNESGLRAKVSCGLLDCYIQYRPIEYIILKESEDDLSTLSRKKFKDRRKELEGLDYYTFTIALKDGRKDVVKALSGNPDEYNYLLLYFANHLQKDLKLAAGVDTLDCKLFHFERTYGITSYVKFVIGFEPISARKKAENRIILYHGDKLGLPEISLSLAEKDIQNNPRIIFKD